MSHAPGDVIGGVAVIVFLALVNIRGLGESAKLNIALAVLDLVTQIVLIGLGTVLVLHPSVLINQVHLGVAPSLSQLIFAVSISMLAYTGIETVSNMAEEAHDPGEQVPKAVNTVLIAVLAIYAGISIVALSALPVTENAAGHYSTALGTTYSNDPVLGIVSALNLHGALATGAQYYVGALAATILLIATNAGMIGISRLSWSLAEHRQLPGVFARLHPRFHTPWFTILFFAAIAVVLVLPGNTNFLGNLYSFGAMLSFTIAHLSIIALRRSKPELYRPYRAPWNVRWRGADIPLTAVLGAVGTGAAFVSVIVLHTEARIIGTAWIGLGLIGYLLYRRHLGIDPAGPAAGAPSRSVRWASSRSPTARPWCRSSAPTSTPTRCAVPRPWSIQMPSSRPSTCSRFPPSTSCRRGFEEQEYEARCALDIARLQARARGLKVRVKLIRTRNPGRAIVEEALERGSDLIYISTEHAPSNERLLGPTTRYILANRPCRVIVEGGDGGKPAALPASRAPAAAQPA